MSQPMTEEARRRTEFEGPRALAAGDLERAAEFRRDLPFRLAKGCRNTARIRRASACHNPAASPIAIRRSAVASPIRASPATSQAARSTRWWKAACPGAGATLGASSIVCRMRAIPGTALPSSTLM